MKRAFFLKLGLKKEEIFLIDHYVITNCMVSEDF